MISKRLKTIADLVDNNKVVFDVGSDHALLPCFLVSNNIVKKAYAGDVKEGPLNSAKKNITKFNLEDKVIPILSDGLTNADDDVDVVIISGMGHHTIEDILDKADLNKYDYLICEPNKDVNLFRQYLSDHHYTIIDEKVVFDDFYYEIVKFNSKYHDSYSDIEIKYGPILLKNRDQIFIEYLNNKLNKLKNIVDKTNKQEHIDSIKQIEAILIGE